MYVEAHAPELFEIVEENTPLEKLAGGFRFTEGPLWDRRKQCLLFSDIPDNTIFQYDGSGISIYRKPSHMSNGLTFDLQGNLIACEHAASRVTLTSPDGTMAVIADRFMGKQLNSPNDVAVKSDGTIYFTDPAYGRGEFVGIKRSQDLPFQGVYRVNENDGLILLTKDDFVAPNGLCFSPKEDILYINDSEKKLIMAYDVAQDGLIGCERIFFDKFKASSNSGAPDGMKVDEQGNVYCTGPGGIWIINERGAHIGTIRVPEVTSNMNWGGPDWNILYITASTSIYSIKMKVCGNKLPYMI